MDQLANSYIALLATITAVTVAYREAFGPQQTEITEAIIRAFAVRARYKPVVNVVTSIVIAAAIGAVLAIYTTWEVVPIAAIAGLFAATKAAEVHDNRKVTAGDE